MRAFFLAPLVLLAACATMDGSPGPVALEQTQRVGPYLVTPLSVVEDSRCFENARCVWAGRVTVRVQIEGGYDAAGERNLTLGIPAVLGRRSVVLDGVTPGRNAGTVLSDAAYRFHFSLAD